MERAKIILYRSLRDIFWSGRLSGVENKGFACPNAIDNGLN